MKRNFSETPQELTVLCGTVKELVKQNKFQESEALIKEAMERFPHAPEPHNLFGLLFEMQGDHPAAMKHFRAACALDPAYVPARHNLDLFGSFYPKGKWAYDRSDCPEEKKGDGYKIEYGADGIGHVVEDEQADMSMG